MKGGGEGCRGAKEAGPRSKVAMDDAMAGVWRRQTLASWGVEEPGAAEAANHPHDDGVR